MVVRARVIDWDAYGAGIREALCIEPWEWEAQEPDEDPDWLDTTVGDLLAAAGVGLCT